MKFSKIFLLFVFLSNLLPYTIIPNVGSLTHLLPHLLG